MSKEERIHGAKMFMAFAIGFSAWAIAAPVISFHIPEFWDALPYFTLVGLMYIQALAAAALLGISNRPQKSRDIVVGTASAAVMLVIAPESIRVALIKVPISSRW